MGSVIVVYNSRSDDLLHTADTYCDGLKTVGDLHSFSVGLWVCQLGARVWSSVTWCICPVCVLSFYILNNREFWDSFFLNDQAICSESKGVHPAALAAAYCISPKYHLRILVHAVALLLQWKTEKTGQYLFSKVFLYAVCGGLVRCAVCVCRDFWLM